MFFEMILSAMAQYSQYIDDDEDVMLSERISFSSRTFQEEEEEEERPSSSNGISGDKSDEAKTADGDNDGEKTRWEPKQYPVSCLLEQREHYQCCKLIYLMQKTYIR